MTKEQTEKLKNDLTPFIDKTVTIIFRSDFGMGACHLIGKLINVELGNYAQYPNAIFLIIKPKRKHKMYKYSFYGEKEFKVFSGEKEKIDNFKVTKETSDVIIKEGKYHSFDKRYITDYGTENLITEFIPE